MHTLLFLLLLAGTHSATARTHSLKYFFTVSPQVPNFPEFVAVGYVDEVQISHYDSNTKKVELKQDWMLKATDSEFWKGLTQYFLGHQQDFKVYIEILKALFNQTEELPSMSLLQKSPSSPVSCHATGFYPDSAMLFWRKDGEELHEDVYVGEVLPNHDGTFQMSTDLQVSSIPPEDWRRYDCVFQISGVKEDIVKTLDKDSVESNREKPTDVTTIIIIIIVAAVVALAVVLAVTGFIVYRKRNAECPPSPGNDPNVLMPLNPDGQVSNSPSETSS
ncbi:major histocompatibility complex class I-related gene protein-like isoform X3 [Paralichthys olivaceus]|uniref:major histocompatibility complex class I-related gene protein-like isoform X3 n=1 Tax=Paralichthys olivaceus TaxID=8255 RepID=UPI00375334F4